jgi:chondroitin 4-sulfotransferase 11
MINAKKGFIFCHLPKNAGTSICQALQRAGGYTAVPYPSIVRDAQLVWKRGECGRVLHYIGKDLWNACFKFAFVRNPWDRLVSGWEFTRQKGYHDLSFERFLAEPPHAERGGNLDERGRTINTQWHVMAQVQHLVRGGKLAVDFLGRVENLEQDWKAISARIDCDIPLPHANASPRGHYRGYYDAATLAAATALVRGDAETFGYGF